MRRPAAGARRAPGVHPRRERSRARGNEGGCTPRETRKDGATPRAALAIGRMPICAFPQSADGESSSVPVQGGEGMYGGTRHAPVPRELRRTSGRWLPGTMIAVCRVLASMLGGSSSAFAQASPTTSTEHTHAIVKPSVVFAQTHWTGYLTDAPFTARISPHCSPSCAARQGRRKLEAGGKCSELQILRGSWSQQDTACQTI
jgi:hypothetical protein